MNNDEMEATLLKHGFTPKEIALMQKRIRRGVKEGDTEITLLSLVPILKDRFYNVFSIVSLIISVFILNIYFKYPMSTASFISNVIVTLVGLFCTYHIGALPLSYKSYRYCKKKQG
ncbi:urea transporter [Symbiopectobacterium purcellii]|uniref:Urea transporter n=1 Tax=Symbiopectobacterium purcellii TaxID=2871826 RepID=A0ABX9AS69_9ENTR|nr:urea transporter [Symbiopectobacterium purcellii]QZN97201.1 urea transporter [Symbiopectobacterium purcellii]